MYEEPLEQQKWKCFLYRSSLVIKNGYSMLSINREKVVANGGQYFLLWFLHSFLNETLFSQKRNSKSSIKAPIYNTKYKLLHLMSSLTK